MTLSYVLKSTVQKLSLWKMPDLLDGFKYVQLCSDCSSCNGGRRWHRRWQRSKWHLLDIRWSYTLHRQKTLLHALNAGLHLSTRQVIFWDVKTLILAWLPHNTDLKLNLLPQPWGFVIKCMASIDITDCFIHYNTLWKHPIYIRLLQAEQDSATRNRQLMVLSHWPHVAELVAELVSESFHTSRMCGNKSACPGNLVYI